MLTRRTVLVGAAVVVALVVGVIGVLMVNAGSDPAGGDGGSADGGGGTGDDSSAGEDAPVADWPQQDGEFSVLEGTVTAERLAITPAGDGAVPEVRVGGSLADVASVSPVLQPAPDGTGLGLVMTIDAPVGGAGVYTGEVLLVDADEPVSEPLGVEVTVVAPDSETIPDTVPIASPDRVEERPDGRYVAGELLITTSATGEDADDLIRALAVENDAQIVGSVRSVGLYQLRFPGISADDLDDLALAITGHPDVVVATPVILFSGTAGTGSSTDDPETEWEPLEMIGAPEAWAGGVTGQGVRVGVIDTLFAGGHEDLRDPQTNWGFTWQDPDDCGDKQVCHGTHVAGTACAAGNNGRGLVGVAHGCSLLFYNTGKPITLSKIVELMDQAARDGARVVNMSLGTTRLVNLGYKSRCDEWHNDRPDSARELKNDRTVMASTLRRLAELGANDEDYADPLFILAAGNDDVDAAKCSLIPFGVEVPGAPDLSAASNPSNMLAVGATDRHQQQADFSNYGEAVDIYAPGVNIHSSSLYTCGLESAWWNPFDSGEWQCHNFYAPESGTSMAAPHVTGTAALMFEANPDLDAHTAGDCIRGTAKQAHALPHLNVPAAVNCAERGGTPPLDFEALRSAPVPALCIHPAGQLVDGELPGIDPHDGHVTLRDVAAFGDITGDGQTDAVAVIGCSAGGVSWPDTVHVYGPGPLHLAQLDLTEQYSTGWEPREFVQEATVDNGTFTVTWSTHAPGDSMASPSLSVRGTFIWTEGVPQLRDVQVVEDRRLPPRMPPDAYPHPDECRAIGGPSLDLVGWPAFAAMCLHIAYELNEEDLAAEYADPPAIAQLFDQPSLALFGEWRFEECGAQRVPDSWLGTACDFTVDDTTIQFTYIAYDDISVIDDVRILP